MDYKIKLFPQDVIIEAPQTHYLLESIMENQISVPFSCKTGECGACTAELMEGQVQNQSGEIISKGNIRICTSYPLSNIQLKIDMIPELQGIKLVHLPCKLSSFHEKGGTYIIKLKLPPNASLQYLPGQYIELNAFGLTRSYSIASARVENDSIELQIRYLDEGLLSQYLPQLKVNQLMRFSGPYGVFFVRESLAPILFVASGTGFAPVQSMILDLINKNTKREMHVYWRMKYGTEFYSELPHQWSLQYPNIKFIPFVSHEDYNWHGRKGDIGEVLLKDFDDLSNFHVYVCGSQNLIQKTKKICEDLRLNMNEFYTDAFVATGNESRGNT